MDSVAQISKLQKLYQIAQHAEMIHISRTLRQTEASQSVEFESSADIGRAEASGLLNVAANCFCRAAAAHSPQPHGKRNMSLPSSSASLYSLLTLHSAPIAIAEATAETQKNWETTALPQTEAAHYWCGEGKGKRGKGENEEKSGHADVRREEREGGKMHKTHNRYLCNRFGLLICEFAQKAKKFEPISSQMLLVISFLSSIFLSAFSVVFDQWNSKIDLPKQSERNVCVCVWASLL